MDELRNPYRPGAGTPPPALLGRDALIDRFGTAMRRTLAGRPGKSLMPIGLRGVGKTVLLNRFCEIAANEGARCGFIEAPETGDFPARLGARVRTILLDLDRAGRASAVVSRALQAFKGFTMHFPSGESVSIDLQPLAGLADSGNLADDLTDLLVATGEAARDRSTGVVIAVDEVQYLDVHELSALVSAIHRTTQLDLPVLLVGAGLPQVPALSGDAKSYAERLFDFPRVDSLAREDAFGAISIPAAEAGVSFEEAALDAIFTESRGYPYCLQEWGYHVWNQASGSPITRADVEAVKPRVEQQLDENFFRVRFDRMTPKEREYLRAMAELGAGPHRSGDIARGLGVVVESVGPRRQTLISKGMIYSPAHGDTAFTVPLFDDFLRRAMPGWRARRRRSRRH